MNAYAASTFYAVDRYASYQRVWKKDYLDGGVILSDRYTTANAVHQGGKLEGAAREEFFSWLYDLEFNRMGLPKPDLVLCLDMPVEMSEALMRRREKAIPEPRRIFTSATMGICTGAERSRKQAAAYFGWATVSCVKDGQLRTIEDIHEELYTYVKACLEDR